MTRAAARFIPAVSRTAAVVPFQLDYHPEFELTLTLNSIGERFVGDHVAHYGDGDLVLVGPNLPHAWQSRAAVDAGQPHLALVLWFTQQWAQGLTTPYPELSGIDQLLAESPRELSFSPATVDAVRPRLLAATFALARAAARGIEALQSYLSLQGYLLLLATNGYDPEVEFRQAQNMASRGVDGLILRGDVHTEPLRRLMATQRIPFVNVGVYHPDKPYPCVGANNELAAWRACSYLIGLGRRDIGIVAAVTANNDRASARFAGAIRALSEHGLTLRPEWALEVPYHLDDARQGARTFLTMAERPSALLCGNDVIAYGVMLEAERRGLHVPHDLSVMGFDDLEWSRHLRPSLTTMHLPTDEVWTRAGQYLVRYLAGQSTTLHHEVDASLVVRESTSPPGPHRGT